MKLFEVLVPWVGGRTPCCLYKQMGAGRKNQPRRNRATVKIPIRPSLFFLQTCLSLTAPFSHLRFSILPGVLGGSSAVKAGAREPSTAAAVFAAAVHDDDVVFSLLFVDPAPVVCFGRFRLVLPLTAVALLTGVLAPRTGEDSAASREAFIVTRLNARPTRCWCLPRQACTASLERDTQMRV